MPPCYTEVSVPILLQTSLVKIRGTWFILKENLILFDSMPHRYKVVNFHLLYWTIMGIRNFNHFRNFGFGTIDLLLFVELWGFSHVICVCNLTYHLLFIILEKTKWVYVKSAFFITLEKYLHYNHLINSLGYNFLKIRNVPPCFL